MEKIQRDGEREMPRGKACERRERGEWNLWFFGGTEWKTRRKRYPTGGLRRCGPVAVQRDRNISNRLPRRPRAVPMPNGHSLFFPECPRKHPVYVPPSDSYQIHPQPWNENKGSCSDPAVWGHVYEKLSHPLETIIGILKRKRRRSFRWNVVGLCPGRYSRENDRWPK